MSLSDLQKNKIEVVFVHQNMEHHEFTNRQAHLRGVIKSITPVGITFVLTHHSLHAEMKGATYFVSFSAGLVVHERAARQ